MGYNLQCNYLISGRPNHNTAVKKKTKRKQTWHNIYWVGWYNVKDEKRHELKFLCSETVLWLALWGPSWSSCHVCFFFFWLVIIYIIYKCAYILNWCSSKQPLKPLDEYPIWVYSVLMAYPCCEYWCITDIHCYHKMLFSRPLLFALFFS